MSGQKLGSRLKLDNNLGSQNGVTTVLTLSLPYFSDSATSCLYRDNAVTTLFMRTGQVAEQTAVRARIRQRLVDLLRDDGVLAVPSAASVALPAGMDGPGLDECRQRAITIMSVAGLAGLPQVCRSRLNQVPGMSIACLAFLPQMGHI